jgi:hypothetical protein
MDAAARREAERVTAFLWEQRAESETAHAFVHAIRTTLVDPLTARESSLADQREQLSAYPPRSRPMGRSGNSI